MVFQPGSYIDMERTVAEKFIYIDHNLASHLWHACAAPIVTKQQMAAASTARPATVQFWARGGSVARAGARGASRPGCRPDVVCGTYVNRVSQS